MKFYIDTANVDEIRKANDMGIIAGVTTNPSLIAKEGRDYAETLKEITSIVDGPISGEVKATTLDAAGMIEEGRAIYALDPAHMVVKIPMTAEGLKAIKVLSSEAKMLEAEEKALKARREQKIKQAESLKAYLMNSMQRVNLNKIEGVMAKISITKGRESTEITDPKAFVEWAKVNDDSLLKYKDPDISKTAVKAAIEAGREIPYAAVVRRPGLTIR